jgi:hypothetical protein
MEELAVFKTKKSKKKFSWFKFWIIVIPGFFATNWCYHAVSKPAEIVGLFDGHFYKNPAATWDAHGDLFSDHSTPIMTPEFLAALAQAETQGNAIARTYWEWNFSTNPFEIYRPASSATGLYQITNGTYELTKNFCIHNGRVVKDGPWHELDTCWFNFFYSRLVPSHAIEMTSAYLHWSITRIIEKYGLRNAPIEKKQDLATIAHLCGPQRADAVARRGLRLARGESCGSHGLQGYLNKVRNLTRVFAKIRTKDDGRAPRYAEN